MMRIRIWLALFLLKLANALLLASKRLAPTQPDEGPSDYAEPDPMDDDDEGAKGGNFWHRHRIIRHDGGVISIVAADDDHIDLPPGAK